MAAWPVLAEIGGTRLERQVGKSRPRLDCVLWPAKLGLPALASSKTVTGRLWTYVRDDRPYGGVAPPAAIFYYSRDRGGAHSCRHLAGYGGILQADAYAGFNELYDPARKPGPLTEAACWS
jgi:hypothetical protein